MPFQKWEGWRLNARQSHSQTSKEESESEIDAIDNLYSFLGTKSGRGSKYSVASFRNFQQINSRENMLLKM